MLRQFTSIFLPEIDEAKYLVPFLTTSNIGVGITEGMACSILRQEDQCTGLSSAAHGDIVSFDYGMFAEIGHRMEVEIEGSTIDKPRIADGLLPGGQKMGG